MTKTTNPFDVIKAEDAPLPKENPLASIRYSKIPRHVPLTEDLPAELEPLADELVRLATQGVTWAHMAGKVGLLPEELRKLCTAYPALHRAVAFGQGSGADVMSEVVYTEAVVNRNAEVALNWLKLRGGWQEPKGGANIKIETGNTTVSIDLDRLRSQAEDQSKLLEYDFDGKDNIVDV